MWKMMRCDLCDKDVASSGWKNHLEAHKRDKPCGFCGKMVGGRKKFCNSSCANSHHHNRKGTGRPLGFCKCGNQLLERHSRFCSKECWARDEHLVFIKQWLKGDVSGEKGKGCVSTHIRKWLFNRSGGKCEAYLDNGARCGWSRINPKTGNVPLTVHHKDGNSDNNRPENLELICPCCHSVTLNYGMLNRGRGRKKRRKMGT
jgi:hypothetical protein